MGVQEQRGWVRMWGAVRRDEGEQGGSLNTQCLHCVVEQAACPMEELSLEHAGESSCEGVLGGEGSGGSASLL